MTHRRSSAQRSLTYDVGGIAGRLRVAKPPRTPPPHWLLSRDKLPFSDELKTMIRHCRFRRSSPSRGLLASMCSRPTVSKLSGHVLTAWLPVSTRKILARSFSSCNEFILLMCYFWSRGCISFARSIHILHDKSW